MKSPLTTDDFAIMADRKLDSDRAHTKVLLDGLAIIAFIISVPATTCHVIMGDNARVEEVYRAEVNRVHEALERCEARP